MLGYNYHHDRGMSIATTERRWSPSRAKLGNHHVDPNFQTAVTQGNIGAVSRRLISLTEFFFSNFLPYLLLGSIFSFLPSSSFFLIQIHSLFIRSLLHRIPSQF
jgi:hypothetical protein